MRNMNQLVRTWFQSIGPSLVIWTAFRLVGLADFLNLATRNFVTSFPLVFVGLPHFWKFETRIVAPQNSNENANLGPSLCGPIKCAMPVSRVMTLSSGGNWGSSVIELPSFTWYRYEVNLGNSITEASQLPPDDNVIKNLKLKRPWWKNCFHSVLQFFAVFWSSETRSA